eukprot:3880338-Amphidinium_carterae.1
MQLTYCFRSRKHCRKLRNGQCFEGSMNTLKAKCRRYVVITVMENDAKLPVCNNLMESKPEANSGL